MGVLFVQRDALDGELVVALQLVSHPISMAVQLEVHVKHFDLQLLRGPFPRGQVILDLRDRSLRVKQAVLGEQLPREVVFNGQFLGDTLVPVLEGLLFEEFKAQG